MAMDPLNPLSEQHLEQITTAIKNAELALQGAQKAQSAGIDTTEHVKQLNDALARLRTIKTVYFPGR